MGCCCGQPEPGGPKTAPRTLKREMRRTFRESGLDGRVRLAFTDCLGPCSEANVVFLYLEGRPHWFRRMNTIEPFAALLHWTRDRAGDTPLPTPLASRSFAWTGGGLGPEPPVADAP
ncbi:MAG TPA: (2Fe-2S) ferredoxin domain-containing protein [Methylomirabilota bacterium]|nr:(2Fe-2S) ferredoxin domain-containing protein [Methylomirabilota bacterium]